MIDWLKATDWSFKKRNPQEDEAPFVWKVSLIADKDNDDITSSFGSDIIDPLRRLLEWRGI